MGVQEGDDVEVVSFAKGDGRIIFLSLSVHIYSLGRLSPLFISYKHLGQKRNSGLNGSSEK